MTTSPQASQGRFTTVDWSLLLGVGVIWGASFLLIKEAVSGFHPATVAWFRLALGASVLACFPSARQGMSSRTDWVMVAVLGVVWMAVPFTLFPIAEQTVDSALAGMINGAAPLFTALIAIIWFRYRPQVTTSVGLLIGFAGVLTISIPSISGGADEFGVLLLVTAVALYGVAFNISAPLQQRNGALAVILWAQIVAVVATTPWGVAGLVDATPDTRSVVSLVLLGVISTGIAFAFFSTLISRVGAPRASVSIYLAPGVAVVLGITVGGESLSTSAITGVALIVLGAFLV